MMKMAADTLVRLGQLGTLVLGSVGVFVALLNQRQQLNAQMFIEFSRRFQELLRLFPTEAWLANHNPSQPIPPSSQELTDCTLFTRADTFRRIFGGYGRAKSSAPWRVRFSGENGREWRQSFLITPLSFIT